MQNIREAEQSEENEYAERQKGNMSTYKKIAEVIQELITAVEHDENDYALLGGNYSCYGFIVETIMCYCLYVDDAHAAKWSDDERLQRAKDRAVELYVRFYETEGTVANDTSGIGGAIKELLKITRNCNSYWSLQQDNKLWCKYLPDRERLFDIITVLLDTYTLKKIKVATLPRRRKEMHTFTYSTTIRSPSASLSLESVKKRKVKGSHSWTTIGESDVENSIDLLNNLAYKRTVFCVDFSSDCKLLVTGTFGDGLHIYDVETGKEHGFAENGQSFDSVCFSPDNEFIAATISDAAVLVLNVATKQRLLEISSKSKSVQFCGENLIFGTNIGTVDIWDIKKGKCVAKLESNQKAAIRDVAVSPDRQLVAAATKENVLLWDIESFTQPYRQYNVGGYCVGLSYDGKVLASTEDRSIELWDLSSTTCISSCTVTDYINSVSFSPSGFIAAGTHDKRVFFWDIRATHPCAMLQGHSSDVNCVTFSKVGGLLATGTGSYDTKDSTVCIWKGFWRSGPTSLMIFVLASTFPSNIGC